MIGLSIITFSLHVDGVSNMVKGFTIKNLQYTPNSGSHYSTPPTLPTLSPLLCDDSPPCYRHISVFHLLLHQKSAFQGTNSTLIRVALTITNNFRSLSRGGCCLFVSTWLPFFCLFSLAAPQGGFENFEDIHEIGIIS